MKKLIYLVALALLVATVSAKPRKAKLPAEADVRKAEFIYNYSVPLSIDQATDSYFDLIQQAYALDSTDRTLQGEYGMLLSVIGLSAKNDTMLDRGIELARKAFLANTADLDYGRHYFEFIQNLRGDSMALEAIKLMRERDPLNEELLQMAIDAQTPKYYVTDTAALFNTMTLLDTLEMAHGKTTETTRKRATLYLMIDDTVHATKTVHDYYQQNKRDRAAALLMMNMFSLLEQPDSVIPIGTEVLRETPTDLSIVIVLANTYLAKEDTTRYLSLLQETMLNDQIPKEFLSDVVIAFAKEIMSKEGLDKNGYPMITDTYAKLVKEHPYDDKLMKDYISWLQLNGEPASTSILEDYVNMHPSDIELWMSLIDTYYQKGQTESAIDATTRAERYFPANVNLPLLKGRLLLSVTPIDSIGVEREFIRADSLVNDSTSNDVRSQIKGALGDLTIARGDTLTGIDLYRQSLRLKPDNYLIANNLAYILALRNSDLPEARALIERCMRFDPEQYFWLDTYAWVLYKQGEYTKAAKQIDLAIEYMNNDPDLNIPDKESEATYEHAGDIHFMAGNVDEAVKNWKRALVFAPDDAMLIRKIKTKKIQP